MLSILYLYRPLQNVSPTRILSLSRILNKKPRQGAINLQMMKYYYCSTADILLLFMLARDVHIDWHVLEFLLGVVPFVSFVLWVFNKAIAENRQETTIQKQKIERQKEKVRMVLTTSTTECTNGEIINRLRLQPLIIDIC